MNDTPPAARSDSTSGDITIVRRQDLLLRPRNVRSVALTGIFIFAIIAALHIGRAVILPVLLAMLLSFLLYPLVRLLARLKIPEGVGAGLVMLLLLTTVGYTAYLLVFPTIDWMERLPDTLRDIEQKLRSLKEPIERVGEATEQVEELAKVGGPAGPQVEVRQATLADLILAQTRDFAVGAIIVIVLLYFLLASGDLFLHKLVKAIPRLTDKKKAVETVRALKQDLATYLATITLINLGLGFATAAAMYLLGVPNAALWGVMATLLNFVPYLGAIVGTTVIALVAMVTFDDPARIAIVPVTYFLLTTIEGYLVTPVVLGVRLTLNPVLLFIGLVFWSWLWGIPGALLAVPLMASMKILLDRFERTQPIGEFLGR